MIPGNIDLTENLDFRKVVKRELPQLPDTWKGNKLNLNSKKTDLSTYIATNNTITSSTGISISSTISSSYSHEFDDSVTSISFNDEEVDIDIHFSNTTNTYTYMTRYNLIYDTYIYYAGYYNNKCIIKLKQDEYEYDVFGNKKPCPIEIPSIPWKKQYKIPEKRIAWENGLKRYDYYTNDILPDIAWEEDQYPFRYSSERKINLRDKYARATNLISWLAGKTRDVIEDYFDPDKDEKKTLSYLTNMSWIRIKDAIVD